MLFRIHGVSNALLRRGASLTASALIAAACSDNAAGSADSGLSAAARQFIQQLAEQQGNMAGYAMENADAQEVSGVFALLGTPESRRFNAHLAAPCKTPDTSIETCMPFGIGPETRQLSACFTSGCEAPGKLFADVYTTTPGHTRPDDRVPITYSTAEPYPRGTVSYSPNPLVRWRTDASAPSMINVNADLDATVTVRLVDEELDLSYRGQVSGQITPSDPRYAVTLQLPHASLQSAVHVAIEHSSSDQFSSVQVSSADGRILATSSGATLVWLDE